MIFLHDLDATLKFLSISNHSHDNDRIPAQYATQNRCNELFAKIRGRIQLLAQKHLSQRFDGSFLTTKTDDFPIPSALVYQ
jgi:hypothetical protein